MRVNIISTLYIQSEHAIKRNDYINDRRTTTATTATTTNHCLE